MMNVVDFRFGLMGMPNFFILFGFITLLTFVLCVWAIVDALKSKLPVEQKLIWVLLIVVFNALGAIAYFIIGKSTRGGSSKKMKKGKNALFRSKSDKMIAGVCAGIADYFNTDPTAIRLLWVLITVFTGLFPGIFAYVIAWIIMPEK